MLISKGKILLKVHNAGPKVSIAPVFGEFDNRELLSVFARSEEVLTQLYYLANQISESHIQLADYFKQRGWHVEH
ncbi:hypothetical protein OCK74_25875 [Chitinophagaceae bacterium LB-8]|uniref:Uncharacterized protein n=1 Tax=Paraflavisolibacter caeni TaxID=2982496 RepID=A0A9X2XZN4_9BACT|nr:hypothetical protein [Paraflavisolibacter caeni]MCU7552574.1 hypothetical protein [Paraflavisolibacter caeni]